MSEGDSKDVILRSASYMAPVAYSECADTFCYSLGYSLGMSMKEIE
jgi:hypothetical protein